MHSVYIQTLPPSEIFFIGETPRTSIPTCNVLPQIRFEFFTQTPGNKADCYNRAINASTNSLILFLECSDLLIDAYALEYVAARMQSDKCDILVADYKVFPWMLTPQESRISAFTHCLHEKKSLSLFDFPELIGTDNLLAKVFSKKFIQDKSVTFLDTAAFPDKIFTVQAFCKARISCTARCILLHSEGTSMRDATPQSCQQELFHLRALQEIVLGTDNEQLKIAYYEYLLFLCSRFHLQESACMDKSERLLALKQWNTLLQLIPLQQIKNFADEHTLEYLQYIHEGFLENALEFSFSAHAADIAIPSMFGTTFDRMSTVSSQKFSYHLQQVYKQFPPHKTVRKKGKPFTVVPKASIAVAWGNKNFEVLDLRTNQLRSLEESVKNVSFSKKLKQQFFSADASCKDDETTMPTTALKVLTLCSTAHGGAGEGSMRRIKALRAMKIDARMVSLDSWREENFVGRLLPAVDGLNVLRQREIYEAFMGKIALSDKDTFLGHEFFPSPFSAVDFRQLEPLVNWADIVHLHWVDGMLDYEHMPEILRDKPVVWTMSDMNPFTGGCHYSEGCQQYQKQCEDCPQFSGKEASLPHQTWQLREKVYQQLNLTAVSPSPNIATLARQSSLLRAKDITVIPNAYPTDRFVPLERGKARRYFNLPLYRPILLLGATSLNVVRKGKHLVTEALHCLSEQNPNLAQQLLVVTFGLHRFESCCEVKHMEFIPQTFLPVLYSAADATVVPSLEDTGPMTVGESLLCGTPVVGFSSLGLLSLLGEHKRTVYIAEAFSTEDLAKGIQWGLTLPNDNTTRNELRKLASKECSPKVAAMRHANLYAKVLGKQFKQDSVNAQVTLGEADTDESDTVDTTGILDGLFDPTPEEDKMIIRHWVVRREGRDESASLFSDKFDYNDFTYARRSHMSQLIRGYLSNPDGSNVDMDICDLKAYQDGLCAAFIEQMLPKGDEKILEIGGAISRILTHYGAHNLYERWNIDKFEGVGNGPGYFPVNPRFKVIPHYMGEFRPELPDNYFDFVFSTSVLEHVPENETTYKAILDDINRVLKPGGYSLHLIDFGLKTEHDTIMHGIVQYFFQHAPTLNTFVPPHAYSHKNDFYYMPRYRYDWRWKPVLQTAYKDFGKPTSINIFWRKPL